MANWTTTHTYSPTYPESMRKGTKNHTTFPEFIKYCQIGKKKLKKKLIKKLQHYYDEVIVGDGYIYCRAVNAPCLLTAHMDTVHKVVVQNYYEWTNEKGEHIIASPDGIGGDDRCGVYMIMKILQTTDLRPAILFCEDEEEGGVGSEKFVKKTYVDETGEEKTFIEELSNLKYLIELDRAHADDLVFYDDDNSEFHEFCADVTGYIETYGSFSDICNLSPVCGIASVNISCGYHDQHTLRETVNMEEMYRSMDVVIKLIREAQKDETPAYEFVEYKYPFKYTKNYSWGDYYGNYYGDYDYYNYGTKPTTTATDTHVIEFTFFMNGIEITTDIICDDEYEGVAKLMINNPTICYNDIIDYYWVR